MEGTINKRRIITLGLLMIMGFAFAQDNEIGTLIIKTDNFSDDKGQAVIKLFKRDDDLFGEAF
ncbi:MAG: hypothetical protein JKX73_10290, partial [Flavobacteriales bacterium]|nr:hypothetical protein [Flavobacteriales bacterium]